LFKLCREYQISQALYYQWRDKFLEGGRRALVNGGLDENAHKAEIERLRKIIVRPAHYGAGDTG